LTLNFVLNHIVQKVNYFFCDQHGGEGRLSERFAGAMQHITGDDVRYGYAFS